MDGNIKISDKEIAEFIKQNIQKNEEEAARKRAERQQEKVNELLDKSGIGYRFRHRTFETFQVNEYNKHTLIEARKFVENFNIHSQGLLFTGPVGVGKTHIAAAIANELVKNLYTVAFGNVTDIISLIKKTYNNDSIMTENDVIEMLTHVDLLIIDDLGKENPTQNTSMILYQIINRLYEDQKPVVITTNYRGKELAKQLGERGDAIVSRLTEMCDPVIMDGPDWRLKNARNS